MRMILSLAALVLLIWALIKLIPALFRISGNRAYAEGDIKKALNCYKRSSEMFGGDPASKNLYALMLMRTGDFKTAEQVLNGVILYGGAKPAQKTDAKTYRCMVYQKLGRLDEALEDAEELFEAVKNTTIYGMLGYLRQLKGAPELDFCLEAYDYNSDDRDICDNLAVAYIRSGDVENAVKITEKLRQDFPDFTEAYYHSALAALKKGDKKAALEFLEKTADCKRTALTTVSVSEIEDLKNKIISE